MHVALLTHLFPARSETFIREHAVGLRRRGHEVTIIARGCGDGIGMGELCALDAMGLHRRYVGNYHRHRLNRIHALVAWWRYAEMRPLLAGADVARRRRWLVTLAKAEAIRRAAPDILHIHYGDHACALAQLAPDLMRNLPCLVTWHGYDANTASIVAQYDNYRVLFRSGAMHSVGSAFMRERLLALGADPKRVNVIPMGVDLTLFDYKPRALQTGEPLRIVSVGRLEMVKGHHVLIDAMALLAAQAVPFQLRIVGGGSLEKALEAQIRSHGLQDMIRLLGPRPPQEIAQELHAAHLFALTGVKEPNGRVESQGVVFAEAQATGLPVIASRLGGVPGSVLDGQSGVLCPPGDVAAVAAALRTFVDHPERVKTFGAAGRHFVEAEFSLERMLDRFETLYNDIRSCA